jgi:hypothetical protein
MKELYMTEQDLYHDGEHNVSVEGSSNENSMYDVEGPAYDVEQGEFSNGKRKFLVGDTFRFDYNINPVSNIFDYSRS